MSCSTNSGFPSAAAAMRSSVPRRKRLVCEQRFHEALALALGQRLEQDRGRVRLPARPAGPDFEKLGPGQAEQQDRRLARPFRDVLDQVEKGGLGPVDVIQHDDERICPRERLEQPAGCAEALGGCQLALGQPDDLGQLAGNLCGVGLALEQKLDLPCGVRRRVRFCQACGCADDLGEGPERDALPVRQAAAANDHGVGAEPPGELLDEP